MPAPRGSGTIATAGRRNPELAAELGAGTTPMPRDQINPVADVISDDQDGGEMAGAGALIYPGELLTFGSTLAVLLPGDSRESYFSAKHVAVARQGETAEEIVGRGVALTNSTVWELIDDVMDRMEAEAAADQPGADPTQGP